MNQKRFWISGVIIFCLIIAIGTSVDINFLTADSNEPYELSTLGQESHEGLNKIDSPNDGVNANYSWTSWINTSDGDGDLEVDTLNVYYNLSNFNVTGYFGIDFHLEVFLDLNGSVVLLESKGDEFYEFVEPNNSYLWSYEWCAKEEGNYSLTVNQYVWGEYNITFIHQEEFAWVNLSKFKLIQNYSSSILTTDLDQDTRDDTINFVYSLNFSSQGYYNLEFIVQIFHWDELYGEWKYLFTDYDYEYVEVDDNEIANLTYQYKAWYDGDYQFRILIEQDGYYSYERLVEEVHEWYNASAFILIKEWNGVFTELDKDGDSCPDSFSIEYAFSFSISEIVDLEITVEILLWEDSGGSNAYWDFQGSIYDGFSAEVVAGEIYLHDLEWKASAEGQYQVNVRIYDESNGFSIIEQTYDDIYLCSYEIISDWKSWTEEIDKDQDGSIDSIRLNYALLFTSNDWMDLRVEVEAEYWQNSEYQFRRYHTTYFEGNVTSTSYYLCYFDFYAEELGEYKFFVEIETLDGFDILEDEVKSWNASDIFNLIREWSYSTSESDMDNDGLIDTIFIDFDVAFSISGFFSLYIEIDISSFNDQTGSWQYESDRMHQFSKNVTAGESYLSTFRFSAPSTADYKIESSWTEITGYGNIGYQDLDLVFGPIYWHGYQYTLFTETNYSFTPEDSDSDGYNDSLVIDFSFKCKSDQNLLIAFMIEIDNYNTVYERWESIASPYFPEIHIYQENVVSDAWYSWNYKWGVPFNGTFNITVVCSSPYFILDTQVGNFLFENATKFNEIPLEAENWIVGYDTNQDGSNDTVEVGFKFNFDQSGSVDLNISIDMILVPDMYDYSSWNVDRVWGNFSTDVLAGTQYDWSINIPIDPSLYGIFIIRVYDRGVAVFYSMEYLFVPDPFNYGYINPLVPVIPPEPTTIITTTTIPVITTTTTTGKITPGWNLVIIILVLSCLISVENYRKFRK